MTAPRRAPLLAVAAAALLTVAACGGGDDGSGDGASGEPRTLTVLAAASLTESFDEIADLYESEHAGVTVKLSYDSSAVLAEQVNQGSPADVLATADAKTMASVVDEGNAEGEPTSFATNTLVIVTPPDNPGDVTGIDDLGDATFAVCVPQAPCGDAPKRLLELDGSTATPTTEEDNVKGVLTKVTLGEVDAGLVYRTDALAAGDAVTTVEAQNASEVVNVNPITVLSGSAVADDAQAFVDLVLSDEGQKVLEAHGFGPAAS
ncbi:molybdate ABC transporter substrate-binding protein [Mumia zhuanghuii]|uniref:Molybdate ABC transporter substrate-binding protein n=2 Tax=Mumia TaxID=1546255 RepID=A0ABW1QHE7_9ACTN|nr:MULTISPECIES: molybdate ABC transporter substrate-binding protein [Mumia]KAA1422711.1 molybdate ABC transporter substrate-binding protein [Mumia zhuanghuii]